MNSSDGLTGTPNYSSSVPAVLAGQGYTGSSSLSGITASTAGDKGVGSLQSVSNFTFSSSTNLSFSFWMNTASYSAGEALVSIGSYNYAGGGPGFLSVRLNASQLQLDEAGDGNSEVAFVLSTTGLPTNTWVNVVAAFSNTTNSATIYVDGTQFAQSSGSWKAQPMVANSDPTPLVIGWRYAESSEYPGSPYTGLISDAQLYNGALTATDAENIYTNGSDVPEPTTLGVLGGIAASTLLRRRSICRPSLNLTA